jgi:hypothetical protein
MNVTESFQVSVQESTPADGRWLLIDASPTEVLVNATARTCVTDVTALRKLRAIVNHLIEAPEVTQASMLAAIAAEFEE